MAFAVALFATSCSQDELLDDGGTDVPVTFTATVDYSIETPGDDATGSMKLADTRATSIEDDAPTRFYAQAISNGTLSEVVAGTKNDDDTYSFTFHVAPGTECEYMFWADNAKDDEQPTDLRSVPYTMGNIAFAATAQGTPENVNKSIELKHVVAKLTLKTNTAVTTQYGSTIRLTASCASTYNVQTASASDFLNGSASTEMPGEGLAANSEVLSTYVIPQQGNNTITLAAHGMSQAIEDVPLAANTHVTLQGDLSESNSKWGNPTDAYIEEKFRSYVFDDNGAPKGYERFQSGTNYYYKGTLSEVTLFIREIIRDDSFEMQNADIFSYALTDNISCMKDYNNFIFSLPPELGNFGIYVVDSQTANYPDFSVIYPGT